MALNIWNPTVDINQTIINYQINNKIIKLIKNTHTYLYMYIFIYTCQTIKYNYYE